MKPLIYIITCVFTVATLAVSFTQPQYAAPLLLAGFNGGLLIWAVAKTNKQGIPWYAPSFFLLGWIFLIECITPLTTIHLELRSEVLNATISPTLWLQCFFVTTVGLLGIIAGQKLATRQPNQPAIGTSLFEDQTATTSLGHLYAFALGLIAIAAWLYMYKARGGMMAQLNDQNEGRMYMVHQAGGTVWHLAKFGFATTLLLFFYRGPFNLLTLAIAGPIFILVFFFGSRTYTANLVLGLLVVFAARRIKPLPVMAIASSVVLLFIVATFLGTVRATEGDFAEAMYLGLERATDIDEMLLYVFGHLTFMIQRCELIDYLHETKDYQFGKTFLSLLKIIPDFIMPGNNDLPSGNMYYLERLQPDKIGKVSLTSNYFTEMYINLWLLGVFAGGLFLGWTCRVLDTLTQRLLAQRVQLRSGTLAVVCGLLSMQMFSILKSGIQMFLETFYFLLPVLPLLWINFRSAGSAPHPQPTHQNQHQPPHA